MIQELPSVTPPQEPSQAQPPAAPSPLEMDAFSLLWSLVPPSAKAALAGALAVVALALALVFTRPTMVDGAKMFMVELNASIAVVAVAIFYFRRELMKGLLLLEEFAYYAQDEAKMQMEMARYQMHALGRQLGGAGEGAHHPDAMVELFRSLGPMVSFLLAPQKSALNWGMFAMKVAQNAFNLYKQASHKQ